MEKFKKRKQIKNKRIISIIIITLLFISWILLSFASRYNKITEIKIDFTENIPIYTKEEIIKEINKNVDIGTRMLDLDLILIEEKLKKKDWIKTVEAFVSNKTLNLKIKYKKAVFKIITKQNEIKYIGENSEILSVSKNVTFKSPLAINYDILKNDSLYLNFKNNLTELGKYLIKDSNYSSKNCYFDIQNINEIEMITYNPKIKFILGNLDNFKVKLEKAFYFHNYYKKNNFVFSQVDVRYSNQIIGIKN